MSSLGEKERKLITIEDLDDHMLIEILIRLPSRSIYQCKSVCNRWLSLISCPYFKQRHDSLYDRKNIIYVLATVTGGSDDHPEYQKDGIIVTNKSTKKVDNKMLLQFSWKTGSQYQQLESKYVLFVSGDLFLYRTKPGELMICSLLTRQSRTLPSPPPFHCNNFNNFMGCLRSNIDPSQYKVVLVQQRDDFNAQGEIYKFLDIAVFPSNDGNWSMFSVLGPQNIGFRVMKWVDISQYATSCNRMLYWATNNMIVGYDPFNNANECEFIDFPDQSISCACITNVQGCIRLYDSEVTSSSTITLWDLNDHTGHIWSKKHIDLSGVNWHQISSVQPVRLSINGFNPIDGDVMYVLLSNSVIFAINLTSKTEHILQDYKPSSTQIIFNFRPCTEILSRLFLIGLLSWPVPLL